MNALFHIHVENGQHVVCATTDGRDHLPVPHGVFGKPRDAIRYAEMRNQHISPLRSSVEASVSLPEVSADGPRGRLSGLTA